MDKFGVDSSKISFDQTNVYDKYTKKAGTFYQQNKKYFWSKTV